MRALRPAFLARGRGSYLGSACLVALTFVLLLGATACGGSSASEPAAAGCEAEVDVVFWGGRQWLELAEALAHDSSDCAEYYITIPPKDADNTVLREPAAFEEIRSLDPRIHPVAEIRFTGDRGWRAWVVGPHPDWARGRTFYDAGVEARRRMAELGLDVADGETWALNELSPEVLEDAPGWRDDIREFLRGLYEGESGMPKARGIVFNIFVPSSTGDATDYKTDLQAWLTDEEFWRDLDTYVDFFAEEVYASPLTWGVADASLETRTEYLNDYLFHMVALAEEGPETAEAARTFLQRTYVPLANAAWPHPAVETLISAETMTHFVAAQVHAMREYATAHPETAPDGGIGFGWAPLEEQSLYSNAGRDMIVSRLAASIRAAYEEEADSEMGACGPPGEEELCTGEVEGAKLNDAWKIFASWD